MKYPKEKCDKLTLTLPKGVLSEYKAYASHKGLHLTKLFVNLIENEMKKDNWVHDNSDESFPKVIQAIAGENFTVYAYLLDGTVRKMDMKPMIARGGVFERLKELDFFRNALTVMNDTVAWDVSGCFDNTTCIDIDPFTVASCEIVPDPLELTEEIVPNRDS